MESCDNAAIKSTHLATKEKIEQMLDQPVMSFTVQDAEISVPLCQRHYNQLCTQLTISAPCESCGGKLLKNERFNRHCPNQDSVNMYLKIVSSDPSNLTKESIICTACYKHFQMIHKNIQSGKANTCISSVSQTQRNTDIDSRLHDVCSQQNSIYKRRAIVQPRVSILNMLCASLADTWGGGPMKQCCYLSCTKISPKKYIHI